MRTENKRLWGFVTIALGVEMFLSVISITAFLGIGIILAIIGSVLYLDATRAARARRGYVQEQQSPAILDEHTSQSELNRIRDRWSAPSVLQRSRSKFVRDVRNDDFYSAGNAEPELGEDVYIGDNHDDYHESLNAAFRRDIPEVFQPGSAAEQIRLLRQEEADRANRARQ